MQEKTIIETDKKQKAHYVSLIPWLGTLGEGPREQPLCFAYHLDYGYVPIIELQESCIIWDDGQITREYPPCNSYEIAQYDEFNLTVAIYTIRQSA